MKLKVTTFCHPDIVNRQYSRVKKKILKKGGIIRLRRETVGSTTQIAPYLAWSDARRLKGRDKGFD